jgi:hypothetical protein
MSLHVYVMLYLRFAWLLFAPDCHRDACCNEWPGQRTVTGQYCTERRYGNTSSPNVVMTRTFCVRLFGTRTLHDGSDIEEGLRGWTADLESDCLPLTSNFASFGIRFVSLGTIRWSSIPCSMPLLRPFPSALGRESFGRQAVCNTMAQRKPEFHILNNQNNCRQHPACCFWLQNQSSSKRRLQCGQNHRFRITRLINNRWVIWVLKVNRVFLPRNAHAWWQSCSLQF